MLEELSEIGHRIDAERGETIEMLNELSTRPTATRLTELGTADSGLLMPVDPAEAARLGAPGGTTDVIAWTIQDPIEDEEPTATVVRALNGEQAGHVLDNVMSVALDRLTAHGRTHRLDPQSPAGRVVALHQQRGG